MYTISGRPQTQAGRSFHQELPWLPGQTPTLTTELSQWKPIATCDQVREHSPELPQMKKQLRHCAYKKSHTSQEQPHSRLSLFQATFRFPSGIPPSQHLHRPQHQMKMESKKKKSKSNLYSLETHLEKCISKIKRFGAHLFVRSTYTEHHNIS